MGGQGSDGFADILRGDNKLIILSGAVLGVITALAASRGYLGPGSAFPAFGWIVIGLLVCELVFSLLRGLSPMQLFTMPARIVALITGVGIDLIGRMLLGTG